MSIAAHMLEQWTWAVVGSHGKNPICDRLVHRLLAGNKKVFRVNPSAPTGAADLATSLRACDEPIDVVDLVINPVKGVEVVNEMGRLGIKNLWIQPGAGSPEILELAKKLNINVHQGCVLVEAPW